LKPKAIDTDFIAPCTHEEADTRMFLHAKHAAIGGSKSINIVSSDTDVFLPFQKYADTVSQPVNA
jgi:hypothetical protein